MAAVFDVVQFGLLAYLGWQVFELRERDRR